VVYIEIHSGNGIEKILGMLTSIVFCIFNFLYTCKIMICKYSCKYL
jgi:hypothetical protein